MGRPYSRDLRERVVSAVEEDGLSRRKAAAHFAVGISTVINWARRFRATGSILPGKMSGHKPKPIIGEHRTMVDEEVQLRCIGVRSRLVRISTLGVVANSWKTFAGSRPESCTPSR